MYAIIETGSKQYWVNPEELIQVERLEAKEGDKVELKALWASDNKDGGKKTAKVTAEVVKHLRGKKIVIYKTKAKNTYQKTQGRRQELTELKIKDIVIS